MKASVKVVSFTLADLRDPLSLMPISEINPSNLYLKQPRQIKNTEGEVAVFYGRTCGPWMARSSSAGVLTWRKIRQPRPDLLLMLFLKFILINKWGKPELAGLKSM